MSVFFNKTAQVVQLIESDEVVYFWPKNVARSLVFVKATPAYMMELHKKANCHNRVFYKPGTHDPQVVPDKEMDLFIKVTNAGDSGLEIVDIDYTKLVTGQKVRVIAGPFEGAEGYIKRIRKDQRLIVSIEGIVAVATSYIPRAMLEPIE